MSEHTPGPWWIDPKANNHVVSASRPICSVSFHNTSDPEGTRAENAATARLIAKAWTIPQLRAALKAGLKSLEEIGGFMEAEYGPAPVLEQMRAALKLGQDNG